MFLNQTRSISCVSPELTTTELKSSLMDSEFLSESPNSSAKEEQFSGGTEQPFRSWLQFSHVKQSIINRLYYDS